MWELGARPLNFSGEIKRVLGFFFWTPGSAFWVRLSPNGGCGAGRAPRGLSHRKRVTGTRSPSGRSPRRRVTARVFGGRGGITARRRAPSVTPGVGFGARTAPFWARAPRPWVHPWIQRRPPAPLPSPRPPSPRPSSPHPPSPRPPGEKKRENLKFRRRGTRVGAGRQPFTPGTPKFSGGARSLPGKGSGRGPRRLAGLPAPLGRPSWLGGGGGGGGLTPWWWVVRGGRDGRAGRVGNAARGRGWRGRDAGPLTLSPLQQRSEVASGEGHHVGGLSPQHLQRQLLQQVTEAGRKPQGAARGGAGHGRHSQASLQGWKRG